MSEARWCDNGGHAFSTNDDGWEVYSGARNYRDSNGVKRTETVQRDVCGACVKRGQGAPILTATANPVQGAI